MRSQEPYITVREAAAILGRPLRTTLRLVERGDLKVARKLPGLRGAYLLRRTEVERFHAREAAVALAKAGAA